MAERSGIGRGRQPLTRAEWARDRLRHAIVIGELQPGERILVKELDKRWDLSATPMREALRSLAGEGLITLDAQRGARVSELSMPEMFEIYELRLLIEPYAFTLSLAHGGDEWRERLRPAWDDLRACHARGASSPLELEPAHTNFHLALLAGCGSSAILRLSSILATQVLRFRMLLAPKRPGGNRQSLAEHRRLYELALARRVEEGTAFLAMHQAWPLATVFESHTLANATTRLAEFRLDRLLEGLATLDGAQPLKAARALTAGSRNRSAGPTA
jgi:GntR family carbon starvation induced transcriptional regulator